MERRVDDRRLRWIHHGAGGCVSDGRCRRRIDAQVSMVANRRQDGGCAVVDIAIAGNRSECLQFVLFPHCPHEQNKRKQKDKVSQNLKDISILKWICNVFDWLDSLTMYIKISINRIRIKRESETDESIGRKF